MGERASYRQAKKDRIDRALAFGMAIPFVPFGIQIVAAPFYPGYSFLNRDASTLGSDGSTAPWIFNLGTLAVGLCEVVAAWGFLCGLPRVSASAVLAWATCVALASTALGSLNAFLHPLPDPRHTEGVLSLLGSGVLLLPVLTGLILWRLRGRAWATPALVLSVLVWLSLIPIMSGLVQRLSVAAQIDMPGFQAFLNGYHGVLQRAAAAAMFGPVAFAAWLLRRSRSRAAHRSVDATRSAGKRVQPRIARITRKSKRIYPCLPCYPWLSTWRFSAPG